MRASITIGLFCGMVSAWAQSGQPTITSVDPQTVVAGSASITLTVHGTNFISSDAVFLNIYQMPTTFVSSSTLTASVDASYLSFDNYWGVQVGGTQRVSNTVQFAVLPPGISGIYPHTSDDQTDLILYVEGANFLPSSIVVFDGKNLDTTFVTDTNTGAHSLGASVPLAGLTQGKTVLVYVVNADSQSEPVSFTIGGSPPIGLQGVGAAFSGKPIKTLSPAINAYAGGVNLADADQLGEPDHTRIFVNNERADITSVVASHGSSPSSINFVIPYDTPLGIATVSVLNDGAYSWAIIVPIDAYSPIIDCTDLSDPSQDFCGTHLDGSLVSTKSPATQGETIHLLVDGLGALYLPPTPILTIAGSAVACTLARTGNGELQLTFTAPNLPAGSYPITVSMDGRVSPTELFPIGGSASTSAPMVQNVLNQYDGPLAPGSLAQADGQNLSDAQQQGPISNPQASVNGFSAAIEQAGPNAVIFQIPPQAAPGAASVTVTNDSVASNAYSISVVPYAPTMEYYTGAQKLCVCKRSDASSVSASKPAQPGEALTISVYGLGASDPPPPISLTVGGIPTQASLTKSTSVAGIVIYAIHFTVPNITSGLAAMIVSLGGANSPAVQLPVQSSTAPGTLTVSQTGTTFRAVAGSITTLARAVSVGGTGAPINWVAFPTTFSGGDWLQVSPTTGTSSSFQTQLIQITASASKLKAGDFFGQITIRPTDGSAAQIISVVLSVPAASPGSVVEPTGMIFVSSPNNVPAAQTTQITNPSTGTVSFSAAVQVSGSSSFQLDVTPASGSVSPGPAQPISIQPAAGLSEGVYSATVNFAFNDGSKRVVNVLWIVAEGAASSLSSSSSGPLGPASLPRDGACTPSKLLAVFTSLGENFSAPVAYPASISALVVDDCGTPLVNGSVTLNFSNGDLALEMKPDSNQAGSWSATWVPSHPVSSELVVTLNAESSSLTGSVRINGSTPTNPNVPIVSGDGVDTAANYGHVLAPGVMISIFGSQFAVAKDLSDRLPLPTQVSTGGLETVVALGGTALPIYYVSNDQINAMVPYGIAKGTAYLSVIRGSAYSASVPVVILPAAPGVFTRDQSGKGDGVIFGTTPKGVNFTPGAAQPAHAGDALTVYCAGLGELKVPLTAGFPAPSPAIETANKVTATLGGVSANVEFAGLVPGFAGLYQVNVRVPAGVPVGDHVALVLTVAGQSSPPVTVALR